MNATDTQRLARATQTLAQTALRPYLKLPQMTMAAWLEEVDRLSTAYVELTLAHIEGMGVEP